MLVAGAAGIAAVPASAHGRRVAVVDPRLAQIATATPAKRVGDPADSDSTDGSVDPWRST